MPTWCQSLLAAAFGLLLAGCPPTTAGTGDATAAVDGLPDPGPAEQVDTAADEATVLDLAGDAKPADTPADTDADTKGKPDSADADASDSEVETDTAAADADDSLDASGDVTPGCAPSGLPAEGKPVTCLPTCPTPVGSPCPGACSWQAVPDMVYPRYGHVALWTGKEVLIFGDRYLVGEPQSMLTGERWIPGSCKGFELLPIPVQKPYDGVNSPMAAYWSGKVALAVTATADFVWRYDPATHLVDKLPAPPGLLCFPQNTAFAAGKLFCWIVPTGQGDDTKDPKKYKAWLLDPESGQWTDAGPSPFLEGVTLVEARPVGTGDSVVLYWQSTSTPSYSAILFHVPSKTWSVVAQPMPLPLPYPMYPSTGGTSGAAAFHELYSVAVLDVEGKSWTPLPTLVGSASSAARSLHWHQERLVVSNCSPFPNDLIHGHQVYSPAEQAWHLTSTIGAWKFPRRYSAVTSVGDGLLVTGGTNGPSSSAVVTHKSGAMLWFPPKKAGLP